MGVLHLADGRIVGYRVNDRNYPITMANAKRAMNVGYCVEKFGRDSNFTAYELEKFGEETGLAPFDRLTWLIVRGINNFARGREDAVRCAVTVTATEAPAPKVKRPAARAYDALILAKKDYEATRPVSEAADLAVRRGGGWPLERAGKALGEETAAELLATLQKHAQQAKEAAEATEAQFIAACDATDEAYREANRLDVIREGWATERTLSLAAQVAQSAATASRHLHKANSIQHKLYSAAERWGHRAG
ncbi:hypothetical protein ACGF12_30325 [Kitasatospora sp. NPDC048296]|uniref:hypothetical protein n=1 Tax=Kitasatospora sp. NPDC048296 TaxID=3364048 RepID=UPI003711B1F1